MAEVKLLSWWPSPFALRVRVALALKRIQYETVEENLPFTKSQLLLASNPVHKSVPVLIHNDKPICESLIILEYIDSTWPEDESRPAFFPKDPHGRATARFWGDFINKKLEAGRNTLKTTGEEEEKCKQEFIEGAIILDEALGKMQGPFFGGSNIGYADIVLSPFLVWVPALVQVIALDFPNQQKCPNLHKWFVAMQNEPTVNSTLPDVEKLAEVVTMFKQMFSSSPK